MRKKIMLWSFAVLLPAASVSAQVISIVDEVPLALRSAELAGAEPIVFELPAAVEVGIPLPVSDADLYHPSLVRMGGYAVEISSFRVSLEFELLQHAYREELLRRGWSLALLPWQEQQIRAIQNLEAQLAERPQHAEAESVRGYVRELKAALKVMLDRHTFVYRGDHRGIVQLSNLGEIGTDVVLIQWQHGKTHPMAQGAAMSDSWLERNLLCAIDDAMVSDDEVRTRYGIRPETQILAVSMAMDGSAETVFLREAETDFAAVHSHTLDDMQAGGWQLAGLSRESLEAGAQARLSFRSDEGRLCDVFLMQLAEDAPVQKVLIADLERP